MKTRIAKNIDDLVGNTPIVQVDSNIYAKLEYFNPSGSAKDRVALQILNDSEINSETTIIEPTSGNTGIGLAAICASRDLKCIIVMPKNMSIERQKMIKAYGAQVILANDMEDSIRVADEIAKNTPNSMIAGQFVNPSNWKAHLKTGEEIFADMEGNIDYFVAGVGTGGTITGVGKVLKDRGVKIVAVEPKNSAVLSGNNKGKHNIQGIGAGFIPDVLDRNIYDEIIQVSDEDAISTAKELAKSKGLFVGISSGAAYFAAKQLDGKNIVVLFPDGGDRYLSEYEF